MYGGHQPSCTITRFSQTDAVYAIYFDTNGSNVPTVPADIAHLLPTQPAHLPPASAASSSEANTQAAERAAQGFQEAFANSSLARDPHSQSLPPTGCLSASHIRAIKKKEDELEEVDNPRQKAAKDKILEQAAAKEDELLKHEDALYDGKINRELLQPLINQPISFRA